MRCAAIAIRLLLLSLACAGVANAATHPAADVPSTANAASPAQTWDKAAAAKYLDSRQAWWQDWPHAQKDHGTVCVSCHTQVPYALARPTLRRELGETKISDPERAMLDSILKRVNLGAEAGTFYTDAANGPGKTHEARNTEQVNNALILASYDSARAMADAASGTMYRTAPAIHADSLKALDAMWASQELTGEKSGAWIWQNFHFSPWEAPESEYAGAAMAAIATGIAPENYRDDPKIQPNLRLLRAYLRREAPNQPLINRITLLWASAKLPGLMTDPERKAIATEIYAKQHADGGWSLSDLGQNPQGQTSWKRHDASPLDPRSDGYATGLIVLALEENGLGKSPESQKGLAWLLANQDKSEGLWPAWSVNVKRDPNSEIGKFMSDAATGFSVLALEHSP